MMEYSVDNLESIFDSLCRHPVTGLPRRLPVGADGMKYDRFQENKINHLREIARRINHPEFPFRFGPLLRLEKPKPDGGVRLIHIPRLRDQIVFRAMHYDLLISAKRHGVDLKTRPPLETVIRFRNALAEFADPVIVRTDITRFYDSIPRAEAVEAVAPFLAGTKTMDLLRRWSDNVTARPLYVAGKKADGPVEGLPQGLSISASLSEVWAKKLDDQLLPRFKYFRFVDDIVIICSDLAEARMAISFLDACLSKLGLSRSISKTKISSLDVGVNWLGMTHFRKNIKLDTKKVFRWLKRFSLMRRDAVKRLMSGEDREAVLNEYLSVITDELYGKTSSKISWFSLADDDGQWNEMDKSLHNMIRSTYRQAGVSIQSYLPSVQKAIEQRKKKLLWIGNKRTSASPTAE